MSHATRFHAAWVLPIVSPPLRDGWVLVRDGRVVDVGRGRAPASHGASFPGAESPGGELHGGAADERIDEVDLGRVAIMPGVVNAHTHLELSGLWGKVPPAGSLVAWVSALMKVRTAAGPDDPAAIVTAIANLEETGTAAVGDISNSLASVVPLVRGRVDAVIFRELIGFSVADPEGRVAKAQIDLAAAIAQARAETIAHGRVRGSLAPHAPYSVSPAMFQAIARATTASPSSVHLGESVDEMRFLRQGDGPFRELLERVGSWNPAWSVPRCGPVEYLSRLGAISPRLLVVHGVCLDDDELRTLAAYGATLVTCPRSNVWVGSGDPPIDRFYAAGVPVAIGTDSLASATDLNLFSELALMHHLAPHVPPAALLASATRVGARALGFDDLGQIAPGARASLITIDLPLTIRDVETYLVEGLDPDQIDWIPSDPRTKTPPPEPVPPRAPALDPPAPPAPATGGQDPHLAWRKDLTST